MSTWISADTHLGEDRFDIMGRPFDTVPEMINFLRTNHNKFVKPDDTYYLVGDVCYQKKPEFLEELKYFNGRKILVRGNHDRVFTDSDLAPYFDQIVPEGEGLDLDIEGVPCYLTHYPTRSKKDRFNLVGHIHGAWKYQLNMFNVGVDVNHYRPVNFDKISFHLKAITEFYDADVWVAYNEINSSYYNTRGKKTSYLP